MQSRYKRRALVKRNSGLAGPPNSLRPDASPASLVHNPRFLQLLEEARQRVRVTGGVPRAEFRRRLDAASAE